MPVDYLAELTGQAKSFSLTHAAGTNPLVHSFTLTPPAGLIRPSRGGEPPTLGLSVMDTVVQSVVTGTRDFEIDLPIIGKWVRVPAPDLPADPLLENPIGGMPAAERLPRLSGTATGLLSTTLTTDMPPNTLMESDPGQDQTPGVPALLGRIKGTVNETTRQLKEVLRTLDPIAVTATLRIRIADDQNPSSTTTTSLVQVQFAGGPFGSLSTVPSTGTALVGANAFTFSLRLPPLFSELRAAEPEVVTLSVYVSLDLSVTPPASTAPVNTTIDFPPIPVQNQELTPLTITLGPGVGCAISSLVPPGATVNIPPSSPASKMMIVFGGTVTSFSPRQSDDQISSVAIARPPAGLMLAT